MVLQRGWQMTQVGKRSLVKSSECARKMGTDERWAVEYKSYTSGRQQKRGNKQSDERGGRRGVMDVKREEMKQERVMSKNRENDREDRKWRTERVMEREEEQERRWWCEKKGEEGSKGAEWQRECLSFCSDASFLICDKWPSSFISPHLTSTVSTKTKKRKHQNLCKNCKNSCLS